MILTPVQRFLAGASLAVLVFCAVIGYQYSVDQGQTTDLNARLAQLQSTVSKINAATESGSNDPLLHTPAFPTTPPSLDLSSLVLTSAAASGVSTGPLQAVTGGTNQINGHTYRTITMDVTITGNLSQILNFYDRIEQGGIRTLTFDNMHLSDSGGRWTVHLQVIAYAQQD